MREETLRINVSQSVIPGPAGSTSPENLLETQKLQGHPKPPTQNLEGRDPAMYILTRPLRDSDTHSPLL